MLKIKTFLLIISFLFVSLLASCSSNNNNTQILDNPNENKEKESEPMDEQMSDFYIKVNETTFTAVFANNSSAIALYELLKENDITVFLHDYGDFEKTGPLGVTLPKNDKQITTEPGDIILYLGNQICIYYDTNSWNFTKLGKINNVTREELLTVFGSNDITVKLTLTK